MRRKTLRRLEQVARKLAAKVGADVNAPEVKELVGEINRHTELRSLTKLI